jgi:hypothetical protein
MIYNVLAISVQIIFHTSFVVLVAILTCQGVMQVVPGAPPADGPKDA